MVSTTYINKKRRKSKMEKFKDILFNNVVFFIITGGTFIIGAIIYLTQ